MRPPRPFFISALLLLFAVSAHSQADGCRGALDALNRVKEQITPKVTTASPEGSSRLRVMESTLMNGTRLCKEFPELWFYLTAVSQRLGDSRNHDYAEEKLQAFQDDGQWDRQNEFDPFSMPQLPPARATLSAQNAVNANSPDASHNKWALVVGIDEFKDDRVPQLEFAAKDSRDFAGYLEDPQQGGFDSKHVLYLANQDATLQKIREDLGILRVRARPQDLIVIYIASHGSPRESDPNGVSYIIANDTNVDNPATLYSTSLQMIDLVQMINREFQAHNVVLILDTCYSGAALSGSSDSGSAPFSLAFDNLTLAKGRAVLTASQSSERSWESKTLGRGGNGYFTHYLLEVLEESRGQQSIYQVFPQVRARVATHVRADLNVSQNPTFEFSDDAGSIVLGSPMSVAQ